MKEKNKYKEGVESAVNKEQTLNEIINDLKSEISKLDAEKSALEINESRIKKSLENLTEKSKNDILKMKKSKEAELDALEADLRHKL